MPFDATNFLRLGSTAFGTSDALASAPLLELIPLGGLGEFGMNMMLVACGETAILVDAGVMFPEPDMLGVDLIIPDVRPLLQRYRDPGAGADARARGSHRRGAARRRRTSTARSTARS